MFASLRVHLLAPVIVAVVPILAIFVASAHAERQLLVEQAAGAATRVAQLVAERNQRAVDAARGLLLGISRMRAAASLDGRSCSESLAPLLEREPIFINIGAVRPDGLLFCSAAPRRGAPNLSDREFFRAALRSRGLGVGEFVLSRVVRGEGGVSFGYPVLGERGEIVAVAFASLAAAGLQRELDGLELPPGSEVAVLDRNGATLSARPDGPSWTGRPFDPRLLAAARAAPARPVALEGNDGVRRLYDLRAVTAPDGTVAMHVLAGVPLGAVLDPVNRLTTRAVIGSLVTIAVALAFAAVAAELVLVRRLRRIADASRRIAGGEIGELAARFDEMARALEDLDGEKRVRDEQLRQAGKMEAVGQLAGGVAHDFNNLLTVILSAASALRERLPADHPAQEDTREIAEAGERAASLTRQLLAFSRRQQLAPRIVDLGETTSGLERMLRRVLGEGVALSVAVRGHAPVHADPSQLEIAILNLAVNARDAMPRGGRIELEVALLAANDPARPAGEDVPAGPLAALVVRDTGVGIDAATRARLFEPFFTTKGPGRGTGLGLAIVRGVVEDCGGVIRVDSEPGKGTAFRLYFPVRTGAAREAVPVPIAEARGGSETILLVEDDPHLRGVIRRTLASRGYAVRAVGNAVEARTLEGAAPHLVVTDVVLPDGNGIELARDLAGRWPSAAFLFISGYTGEHLAAVGALPPNAHLLAKPFSADVLLVRVRAALEPARPAA